MLLTSPILNLSFTDFTVCTPTPTEQLCATYEKEHFFMRKRFELKYKHKQNFDAVLHIIFLASQLLDGYSYAYATNCYVYRGDSKCY